MCCTQHALIEYLIIKPERLLDTIFIFDEVFSASIVKNLRSIGCFCFQYIRNHKNRIINKTFYLIYLRKLHKYLCNCFEIDDIEIYGQDHCEGAEVFWSKELSKISFNLLEDGTANYLSQSELISYNTRYKRKILGTDDRIKKVILTCNIEADPMIEKKAVRVDLKKMWNNLKEPYKKIILENIYCMPYSYLEQIKNKKICILTNKTTNTRAVSNILSNYNPADTYVKLHPLDKNDYIDIVGDFFVPSAQIPFEILYYICDELRTICCIDVLSSCAMACEDNVEIEIYDINGNKAEKYANIGQYCILTNKRFI